MRKTIYFIGIFLAMLACSKEEETYTFVESLEDKLLKAISDTTGLKVFGMGEAYGKTGADALCSASESSGAAGALPS